ncbi:hypothetical protein JW887_02410 [Candidatus Dojkabacteria bacterium]|nr:hypothetical protein [Candidatus Dojkabacteria bacterium]
MNKSITPKTLKSLSRNISIKFITDLFFSSGLNLLSGVINYFFNIVVVQNLSRESFGVFSTMINLVYLIQIPASTISMVITKKVAYNLQYNLSSFKIKYVRFFYILAVALSILIIFLSPVLVMIYFLKGLNVSNIWILSLVLFASIISPVTKGFLQGLQKLKLVNILFFSETILKFLLGIVLVKVSDSPDLAIVAYGIPMIITSILFLPTVKFDKNKQEPIGLNLNLNDFLYTFISLFLINSFFTLDVVYVNENIKSSYSALTLIAKIIFFGSTTFASVLFANLSKRANRNKKLQLLFFSVALNLVLGFGLCLMFIFFKEEMVRLMFKGLYDEVSKYVIVFSFVVSLYSSVYLLVQFLIARKDMYHFFILGAIFLLHFLLFTFNNVTLDNAVFNQSITYAVLFIFMFGAFIIRELCFFKHKEPRE